MAKIVIAGDAVVITSTQTLESIKTLSKYRPKALCLYETDEDGNKEIAFKVAAADKGSISKYGATFAAATRDEDKLATITMTMPAGTTDAEKWVMENIGNAILNLNKVEAQFAEALASVTDEVNAIKENISIAQ